MHYRALNDGAAGAVVATRMYRSIASGTLSSTCRMLPHDSKAFDQRARRCGTVRAVFTSAARLLLERAAGPRFLRPVIFDGGLKWDDPVGACW